MPQTSKQRKREEEGGRRRREEKRKKKQKPAVRQVIAVARHPEMKSRKNYFTNA